MTNEGPSEEGVLNSSACFKLRGDGWTKDIADQFENKEEINVPPNKKMITEVHLILRFPLVPKAILAHVNYYIFADVFQKPWIWLYFQVYDLRGHYYFKRIQ